ncbi:hypothetical protein [Microcoleus sp. D3_18a_C4]|uniref:hypothetical protein n=1 Tax=Microcoleus sp. D3_18a_C4 TaxID=3055332 RepID=UPI002FD40F0D
MVEIQIGNSFIVPTPPRSRHLYIIIAPIPEKQKEQWLMVNLTTSHKIDPNQDCIISPAPDLPNFIRRCSTIEYREARASRKNTIIEAVNNGEWIEGGMIPEKYIYEIQRVGASSKQLIQKYRNILKNIINDIEEKEKLLKA